jgi:methionyl-tRNA formyltransferase
MSQIHVIFAGTPAFALPSLEALASDPAFSVDLVITQPDKPAGRRGIVTPPPVKVAALRLKLPVWQPNNINAEALERDLACDFLVAVAYGQILSDAVLSLPKVAPINLHASLLPRWRGASPIQHTLLAGDSETGVTVQQMVKELDAGPILAQLRTPISTRETFPILHDRLSAMGAELLLKTLRSPLQPRPQERTGVTLCKKLTRANGSVDPKTMTAEEIDRAVRALNPWPGVTLGTVKILAANTQQTTGSIPLACKDGTTLHLARVQPSGGTPMTGAEWERGKRQ